MPAATFSVPVRLECQHGDIQGRERQVFSASFLLFLSFISLKANEFLFFKQAKEVGSGENEILGLDQGKKMVK